MVEPDAAGPEIIRDITTKELGRLFGECSRSCVSAGAEADRGRLVGGDRLDAVLYVERTTLAFGVRDSNFFSPERSRLTTRVRTRGHGRLPELGSLLGRRLLSLDRVLGEDGVHADRHDDGHRDVHHRAGLLLRTAH